MQILYHAGIPGLLPNDVILPGFYGRELTWFHGHCCRAREAILESVRQSHYPAKPSRLTAAYACLSLATAGHYRWRHCPTDKLYLVTPADPSAPFHIGDFNCVQPMPRRPETMEEIAHRYWMHSLPTKVKDWDGIICDEFLTAAPLIVIMQAE